MPQNEFILKTPIRLRILLRGGGEQFNGELSPILISEK